MMRALFLYLSQQPAWQQRLVGFRPTRRLVRRFIAGETLEEAIAAIRQLQQAGAKASLDMLGENVRSEQEARVAQQAYVQSLQMIHAYGLDSNISIKPTHLGLDIDRALCYDLVESLVERAHALHNMVEIDMESSAYTDATLDLVHRLRDRFERVGVAIQAYLYRSERDVRRLIERGIKVRLVKGAYKEPPSVAFPRKKEVDRNYVHLMKILLDSGQYHAIATHDARIIEEAMAYTRAIGRDPRSFEFQMLYGVRRDLQQRLIREGWILRIYVPYGTHWYPYFMRRLAERPANVLFVLRHLFH